MLSEWTKFRSLRSTVYTLLIAVVLMIGLGALFAAITANQPGGLEPGAIRGFHLADPARSSPSWPSACWACC